MLLKTFSSFSVVNSCGQPIPLDLSPKVIEVFCFLLLRSPRPVRREQIIAELFRCDAYNSPKNALNTLLSRLRAKIRNSRLEGNLVAHSTTECVGISMSSKCDMDAKILERAAENTGGAEGQGNFSKVLSIYDGPFFGGF